MDCFEVLNINPTRDEKEIKRAYAKMLRKYYLEKEHKGFQLIRNAYEEAIKQAKQNQEGKSLEFQSIINNFEGSIKEENSEGYHNLQSPAEFMYEFEKYYSNYEKRIDINTWEKLLESDICYNIDTSAEIRNKVLEFIMENYNFSHEVWKVFNSHFSWRERKEELYKIFPEQFIDFIIYKAKEKDFFNYEYLLNCLDNKQDDFIKYYNDGCSALEEYDIYNAKKYIDEAKKLCPNHPDLLILKGRYLMEQGKIDQAKNLFTKVITGYENSFNGYFYRGNLFYKMGNFEEAYNDYKKASLIDSEVIDLLFNLSKCCIGLEKYEEAIKYIDKGLELDPNMLFLHQNKVIILYKLGKKEEVEKICDEQLELNKMKIINRSDIFMTFKIKCLKAKKQYKKVLDLIDEIRKENPDRKKIFRGAKIGALFHLHKGKIFIGLITLLKIIKFIMETI